MKTISKNIVRSSQRKLTEANVHGFTSVALGSDDINHTYTVPRYSISATNGTGYTSVSNSSTSYNAAFLK